MPGRQRAVKQCVSEEDTCAVLVRRRVVNTYCRACPRQVAEKHHFLTPDTPVVDELELPSRLLRESTSGYLSSVGSQPSTAGSRAGSRVAEINRVQTPMESQGDPTRIGSVGRNAGSHDSTAAFVTCVRDGSYSASSSASVKQCSVGTGPKRTGRSGLEVVRRMGKSVEGGEGHRAATCNSDLFTATEPENQKSVKRNTRSSGRKRRAGSLVQGASSRRQKRLCQGKKKSATMYTSLGGPDNSDTAQYENKTPIRGLDIPIAAPSINLDVLSMDLTCSTECSDSAQQPAVEDNGSVQASIDMKLQFLKRKLTSELNKMSTCLTPQPPPPPSSSITPSQASHVHLTHCSTHSSHQHILTQSTDSTGQSSLAAVVSPDHRSTTDTISVNPIACSLDEKNKHEPEEQDVNQGQNDGGRREVKGSEEVWFTEAESDGKPHLEQAGVLLELDRDAEKKNVVHCKTQRSSDSSLQSTEPDPVQLMSYSAGSGDLQQQQQQQQQLGGGEDEGGRAERDSGQEGREEGGAHQSGDGDGCDGDSGDGDGCDGDSGGEKVLEESSESEMEVPRRVGEGMMMMMNSPLTGDEGSPLILSPGLLDAHSSSVRRLSVDLSGLCGLSLNGTNSSRSERESKEGEKGKKLSDTESVKKRRGGVLRPTRNWKQTQRTCRLSTAARGQYGGLALNNAASPSKKILIKRGRNRKGKKTLEGNFSSWSPVRSTATSLSVPCAPSFSTAAAAVEQNSGGGMGCSGSGSAENWSGLEQHFKCLEITPIISSSRSPTHTKSLAPLTSTPIQRQSPDKILQHHTFTPALFIHRHSPHYPLTSTPILQNYAPLTLSSTHQLKAALELEMEAENGTAVSGISRKRGNQLPEYTAGVGSTMERLMEFDEIGFQASDVLPSLPASQCPSPTLPSPPASKCRSKSKTIISRARQNKQRRSNNTRQAQTAVQRGKSCGAKSATRGDSGPKSTTRGAKCVPMSATTSKRGQKKDPIYNNTVVDTKKTSVATREQKATTSIKSGPKTTATDKQPRLKNKDRSAPLKIERARKKLITLQKSGGTNCKTKSKKTKIPGTSKKTKRQYVVPKALRLWTQEQSKQRRAKTREESNTENANSSKQEQMSTTNTERKTCSPEAYPECILVQRSTKKQEKYSMLSSHVIALSLDDSSIPEDILLRL